MANIMKIPNSEYVQLEIPNCSVLDSADQFYDGAVHLKNLPPFSGVLLPLLTNAILALELYAKSLNTWRIIPNYEDHGDGVFGGEVKGKPKSRGHGLSAILNDYEDDLVKDINRLHAEGEIPLDHSGMVERLERYDKFFEQVRYSYENDCLNNLDLQDLWEAVDLMKKIVSLITPIFKVFK